MESATNTVIESSLDRKHFVMVLGTSIPSIAVNPTIVDPALSIPIRKPGDAGK